MGIAAVILGILAFLICWIPLVGLLGLPLSGLGLLLGIAGIVLAALRKGSGLGFQIAGAAFCAFAMIMSISATYIFGKAVSATGDAFAKAADEARAANQKVVNPNAEEKERPHGKQVARDEQADGKPGEEPANAAPKPKDDWADAGNAVEQGEIRVQVETVKVDFVTLR